MRWRETEVRDVMLNPSSIGVKVSPEDIFLLNVRGFYLLLGAAFSQEELTKEKFKDLYLKFLDLAKSNGFTIEYREVTFPGSWIETQLERVNAKRKFSTAINEMLQSNK
ncbi:MAG: hypothetical protein ACOWWO_10425 [Peptococcaceae bacterium]